MLTMATATAELRPGLRQGSCDTGWGGGLGKERRGAGLRASLSSAPSLCLEGQLVSTSAGISPSIPSTCKLEPKAKQTFSPRGSVSAVWVPLLWASQGLSLPCWRSASGQQGGPASGGRQTVSLTWQAGPAVPPATSRFPEEQVTAWGLAQTGPLSIPSSMFYR